MMINIMKPEYFIPVQGEFKMQIAHAKLAAEGVAPEKIFLVEKGDVINYNGKDMILNEKVNSGKYFNRWYWYWGCRKYRVETVIF